MSPVPEASPTHPGWTLCSASPGGVRAGGGAATSKEAHSEGSGRAGRRKESPDCWAAAWLLRAACPVSASRLGPARSPLQFASFPFCFPSSSSPPSSGNLPPETHHSLMWRQGQCRSRAETRGGTSNHAPYLPFTAKEVQEPGQGGSFASHFFSGRRGSSAPHKTFTTALYKATRRLQLQNSPLGICSKCAGFPPGSSN